VLSLRRRTCAKPDELCRCARHRCQSRRLAAPLGAAGTVVGAGCRSGPRSAGSAPALAPSPGSDRQTTVRTVQVQLEDLASCVCQRSPLAATWHRDPSFELYVSAGLQRPRQALSRKRAQDITAPAESTILRARTFVQRGEGSRPRRSRFSRSSLRREGCRELRPLAPTGRFWRVAAKLGTSKLSGVATF
jgi:hypothetical protein